MFVPGIARLGGVEACELGRGSFADDHCASIAQACHQRRVALGDAIMPRFVTGGGGQAIYVNDVFDADRDAVQWPAIITGDKFAMAFGGRIKRAVAVDDDPGLQMCIVLMNAGQVRFNHFDTRSSISNGCTDAGDRL